MYSRVFTRVYLILLVFFSNSITRTPTFRRVTGSVEFRQPFRAFEAFRAFKTFKAFQSDFKAGSKLAIFFPCCFSVASWLLPSFFRSSFVTFELFSLKAFQAFKIQRFHLNFRKYFWIILLRSLLHLITLS